MTLIYFRKKGVVEMFVIILKIISLNLFGCKEVTIVYSGFNNQALNLTYIELYKTPYKERYIAGSSTCSTKEVSIHLTKILSAVKEGQQKYCETVYLPRGISHMWILKNSKDLLDNLKSRSFSQVSSMKTFDCSTLYTTPTA
jgi:hypothetical protein